jgi:hypothetical protein
MDLPIARIPVENRNDLLVLLLLIHRIEHANWPNIHRKV